MWRSKAAFSLQSVKVLPVFLILVSIGPATFAVAVNDCASQEKGVQSIRSRIKADQAAIRRLLAGSQGAELEEWVDLAKDERMAVLKRTLTGIASTFADGIVSTTEQTATNALKPMDIAGYHLPKGIGSLGTGQANVIIGNLQRMGADSPELIQALRRLSSINSKAEKLVVASEIAKVASELKDVAEGMRSDENVEQVAAVFQVIADLAGKGDGAVAFGNALFQGGEDLTQAYIMSLAIGSLSNANADELAGMQSLSNGIKRDVQEVQKAKALLAECKASATNTGDVCVESGLEGKWFHQVHSAEPDLVFERIDDDHFRLLYRSPLLAFLRGSGQRTSYSETVNAASYVSAFEKSLDSTGHTIFTAKYQEFVNMGPAAKPDYRPFSEGIVTISVECGRLHWRRHGIRKQWYEQQGKEFDEEHDDLRSEQR